VPSVGSAALKGSDGGGCLFTEWRFDMNRRWHTLPIALFSLAFLAPASAPAQDNSVAANQEVRIQQLEGQIRTLNGQLEQMNFRVQPMTDRLDKLVADVDYRLRQIEGGARPPAGEQGAGDTQSETGANAPQQQTMTEGDQSGAGAESSGGIGQPRTLGTMSESQYNAQAQQLNQNADAGAASAAAGQAGNENAGTENADQMATNQPYALPGANADQQ